MREEKSAKRLGFALVATALFIAMIAGCGGESEDASGSGDKTYSVYASTTVPTAAIAKAKYVPRINKICRKAWKIIDKNFAVYSATQDPKLSKQERTREGIQLSLLAGLEFWIFDEIQRVGAPRGEEEAVEEIIGPFQASIEIGQKHPTADSFDEVPAKFADYNRQASQYGFTDCLVDQAHLREVESS